MGCVFLHLHLMENFRGSFLKSSKNNFYNLYDSRQKYTSYCIITSKFTVFKIILL